MRQVKSGKWSVAARLGAVAFLSWAVMSGASEGAIYGSFPASFSGFPDVNTSPVIVDYDLVQLHGHLDQDAGDNVILPTSDHLGGSFFDVFVSVDIYGTVSGGELHLGGSLGNGPVEHLDSSHLVAFDYVMGVFSLIFDQVTSTGGWSDSLGNRVGIILDPVFSDAPEFPFGQIFTNVSDGFSPGMADTFALPAAVPEPASVVVWSMLGIGVGLVGRRRARLARALENR